jgi:hypothetical protein
MKYLILIIVIMANLGCANENKQDLKTERENGVLTISAGDKDLLSYQFETMYPPEGIDSVFKRSAFIHPLKTPSGKILTQIQPEGHRHHYGLWNPWTHVYFEGDTLDFWNLAKEEGTVQFAGFNFVEEGEGYAEYSALHEHVAFKKDGSEKVALNEIQTVKVHHLEKDSYLIDFTFEYQTASESPFKILEYRYAGFTWRATEIWNKQNSELFTSAGIDRDGADGSKAKWYVLQGKLGGDYGGAVVMSNPENFNHPEPLRVWPADMTDRGDVFACFCPTKDTDWLLESGKTYILKYRMLVYDGKWNAEEAESAWQDYAADIQ